MQKEKFDDSLNFVSRHYRANTFSAKEGLEKLDIGKRQWWRYRGAAAAIVGVVLVASAAIYSVVSPRLNGRDDVKVEQTDVAKDTKSEVKKIIFVDADLLTVVNEIEKVYGVKVENLPSKEYRLTLSYEGNAADLVDTINELLGTNLKIAE